MTQDIGAPSPGYSVPAIILAGGRATRMGGVDKPLLELDGRPILDHILSGLRPQCGPVALNANGPAERFAAWGMPVLPDPMPDWPGPLAGILAGMIWAAPHARHVLTWPGDTPTPPDDLVRRLAAVAGEGVACAASGGVVHPVIGLWPVALAAALADALRHGRRRVRDFAEIAGLTIAEWSAPPGADDPFQNVNTPEELERVRALSARSGPAGWGSPRSSGK